MVKHFVVHEDFSAIKFFQPVQNSQKRRLSRATRSDNAHHFLRLNRKRNSFEYVQIAKRNVNIFSLNHAHFLFPLAHTEVRFEFSCKLVNLLTWT